MKIFQKLVDFFKLSSVRNHIFQPKMKRLLGHEEEIHIEVIKQRNIIQNMLESILNAEKVLKETL